MRQCPEIPAKEFKLKTVKKGLDGKLWIVSKRSDDKKVWKRKINKKKSNKNTKKGGANAVPHPNNITFEIASLPFVKNKLNEDDTYECPVCLGNADRLLRCGHMICSNCLADARITECPTCRAPKNANPAHISRPIVGVKQITNKLPVPEHLYDIAREINTNFLIAPQQYIDEIKRRLNIVGQRIRVVKNTSQSRTELRLTIENFENIMELIGQGNIIIASHRQGNISSLDDLWVLNVINTNNSFQKLYAIHNNSMTTIQYVNSDEKITWDTERMLQFKREIDRLKSRRNRTNNGSSGTMRCIAAPVNSATFNNNEMIEEYILKYNKDHLLNLFKIHEGEDKSLISYSNNQIIDKISMDKLISLVDLHYNDNPISDFKLEISKDKLIDYIGNYNLKNIESIFNNKYDTIKIRRVENYGRGKGIPFHTDFSKKTMQIPLNNSNEYEGGNLVFINSNGELIKPDRIPGSYSIHSSGTVHGVTNLESGVRYSLFICNTLSKDLSYLIQPVKDQFVFFEKVLKFLNNIEDIKLKELINYYKTIFYKIKELPFELKLINKIHMLHPLEYRKNIKYKTIEIDLFEAIKNQIPFMEDIVKLKYQINNDEIIKREIYNYINFLELFKVTNKNLAPTQLVDLIWHTHQQFPERYYKECLYIAGKFLNHDDSVSKNIIKESAQNRVSLEIYSK